MEVFIKLQKHTRRSDFMKQTKTAVKSSIPVDNLSMGNLYSIDTFIISNRINK